MVTVGWIVLIVAISWGLASFRAPLLVWTVLVGAALALCTTLHAALSPSLIVLWVIFAAVGLSLNLPPLRRALIGNRIFAAFRRLMPPMSNTEREALDAGTVWWEAELFRGDPDWQRLLALPPPQLSQEERTFLDGPVEELCRMLDDWDVTHKRRDLPPDVWRYIKEKGFFGMIIPKRYGGLAFSAQAHSAVVVKTASRSLTAAVTVMVPNSLGPAELLIRYGTDAQRDYYLPRLARGEEVPCFALTSPDAGSDASSIPDRGFVCRSTFEGRNDVLGIRVTWEKRYITLGPVATLLGLAFRLFDPEHLLGKEEDVGITLALIPTTTPGVHIGTRHNPLNIPFQNGPNWGKDVFIPIDWVIGGAERCGEGWHMLMDCLAAGRSISLPALSVGAAKTASRVTGAYARIRKQFKLPIGKFEGIEEPLARIAGYTYFMDAARTLTARGLDAGEQPAVASAIVKYQLTEHMRRLVNDAMDIHGGSGTCLGPQNLIGRAYQAIPISITVEGANILTRTLIVYGQGAIRCHPYVREEMEAAADPDSERGAQRFDRAFFKHIGYDISNIARSFWMGLTSARLVRVPFNGLSRRYAQQLTRLSCAFAVVSDAAMLAYGGGLKRKEKMSGRLADVLSYLYLASAALKRFEDDGRPRADEPLLRFACDYCLHQAERTMVVVIKNFPRVLGQILGGLLFPIGRHLHPPYDELGHEVASTILAPSAVRDRLTDGIFIPAGECDQLGRIEVTLRAVIAAESLEKKLQGFVEEHPLLHGDLDPQLREATRLGVLATHEAAIVREATRLRRAVVRVDDFSPEEFRG
jgi:acyl-CoA dehydrogenase